MTPGAGATGSDLDTRSATTTETGSGITRRLTLTPGGVSFLLLQIWPRPHSRGIFSKVRIMTRSDTIHTLAGALLLFRNAWNAEGEHVTLDLRAEIACEIAAALEIVLPILAGVLAEKWPLEEDER